MEGRDRDIAEKIEVIRNNAKALHDYISSYEERIARLQEERVTAENLVKDAQARIKVAQEETRLTKEKYQKALELRDETYQQLIRDLFQVPSDNLQKHILEQSENSSRIITENSRRIIKDESRKSSVLTVTVAVVSIIASIIITLMFSDDTGARLGEAARSLERRVGAFDERAGSLEAKLGRLGQRADHAAVMQIVQRIDFEGRMAARRSLRTKGDVSLIYKARLSGFFPEVSYGEMLLAFRSSELDKGILPADEEELRRWDLQWLALCRNAADALSRMGAGARVAAGDRLWRKFKASDDPTEYGSWGYHEKNLTYSQLLEYYRKHLESVERRLGFNGQPAAVAEAAAAGAGR
ncbi:MAG TPA: hypothetical protein VN228_19770 [Pyrinomonadaceae bacterium]|nr:hypothetical protein [Pyrinomonadaceae bacterium]